MSPKQDAYQRVTDQIVTALEQGTIPWSKPWRSVRGEAPTSLSTGKAYRGINHWLLSVTALVEGYSSPFWATFKQAKELAVKAARAEGREIVERTNGKRSSYVEIVDGEEIPFLGGVRKGEHGTAIVLWKETKREVDGEERKSFFMTTFTVFNEEQCDGLGLEHELEELPTFDPIEAAESIVTGYIEGPEIRHGGNSAHYAPAWDRVQMPELGQFKAPEYYYSTLLHELAHSTGHEKRLKRDTLLSPKPFGSEDYSKEELVAEMAAAFLSAEAGLEIELEHSAGYIQHWLGALKNDKKLLVSAAAAAQKASDRILGI